MYLKTYKLLREVRFGGNTARVQWTKSLKTVARLYSYATKECYIKKKKTFQPFCNGDNGDAGMILFRHFVHHS